MKNINDTYLCTRYVIIVKEDESIFDRHDSISSYRYIMEGLEDVLYTKCLENAIKFLTRETAELCANKYNIINYKIIECSETYHVNFKELKAEILGLKNHLFRMKNNDLNGYISDGWFYVDETDEYNIYRFGGYKTGYKLDDIVNGRISILDLKERK